MRKENTRRPSESRAHWEDLDEWVRGQVQGLIQELLEEEITEFFGRAKSTRRSTLDSVPGYRNGYGKPRGLTLSSGTIQVRRPRVRNVEERFESRVLPLFARRSKKIAELIRNCISMVWPKATSTWLCGDCWVRTHQYRRARWRD